MWTRAYHKTLQFSICIWWIMIRTHNCHSRGKVRKIELFYNLDLIFDTFVFNMGLPADPLAHFSLENWHISKLLTTLWFTGLFIEAMINESVTSICNNRQGFWRHEDIIRQKSIEVHRATATRHTPSIVWKKPIWEMARDLNACSAVAAAERRRRRWRQIRWRAGAEEGKAALLQRAICIFYCEIHFRS